MSKLMIMSLGGSPEPLKKSIEANQPERIVFLASQDSVLKAGEIINALEPKPTVEFEIVEDPNLILECYQKARHCVERVERHGVQSHEVTVDYTGGTKVMTAALILATIGHPFRFNYVGGEQRNKNGLGTVVDGYEKMFAEMSPWSIFAEEERRQIITLFNRRRFSAVIQVIDTCRKELPFEINAYFRFVRLFSEGFLFWEQFNHEVAVRKMTLGLTALKDYLGINPRAGMEPFQQQVQRCADFLNQLIAATEDGKRMHPLLIDDILNNARRRIMDKRYDDAAARIYRALELYGQICFQEAAGCPTDRVPAEIVPQGIRCEFVGKYSDQKSGLLKLPLGATFEFLKELGHEAGKRFFERQKAIRNIQSNRNSSILAHGIKPVNDKEGQVIFETVSDFVQFKNTLDFPSLP